MKRMLSILLTVCMLLSMVPTVLADETFTDIPGSTLKWNYDDAEGKLTVTGTGDMPEFSSTNAVPWRSYKSAIKTVEIADTVTSISRFAFNGLSALTGINIPNSVTAIGEKAFYGCTALLTAAIGNGVTEIGEQAFASCGALIAVTIGSGVTEIARETFKNCNNVTQIYYVGTRSEWEDVVIQSSNGGLYGISEDKVCCLNPVATGETKDVTWTFDPLTFTLTISGEGAMDDYESSDQGWYEFVKTLRTVVVEPGVTVIGARAFRDFQQVNTVTIPASVTEIHDNAFALCKGLTDVYYGSNEDSWAAIELGAGNGYLTGAEIHYAEECAHTNVSEKVIAVGDETHFIRVICACGTLVSETEPEACSDEDADSKCDFCGGDVALTCNGENHPNAETVYSPNNKETDVFYTHTVVDYCPECEKEVSKPYVESCYDGDDEDALCDACKLGTPCVHENYEASSSTNYNGNNTHTVTTVCGNCYMDIDYDTVDCTDEGKDLVCDVCEGEMNGIDWTLSESGVLTIFGRGPMEDYASFTGMPWSAQRDNVTEIVIEEGVTHIGARSFYRCVLATKVTIADSVKSIGDSAFYRCDSLSAVDFGGDKAQWEDLKAATGTNNEKLLAAEASWDCLHTETTAVTVSNKDGKTHTVTTTCSDCGNVTEAVVECEGEAVYTEIANGKHGVKVECDACEQVIVDELADCVGRSDYTSNGDRTHTVTVTCVDCEAELSATSEKCVDVKTDEDELCDKCGADLHCEHVSVTKTITSDAQAKTHTVTSTCDVCEETVNVETVDCEGTPVYTKLADGKHKATLNCAVCKQLISETEAACVGETKTTSNGDRTHTVTVACPDCEQVLSTEIVDCVDGEDEDELCDVCAENLHCDHPNYVPAYNSNGDHKTHSYAFNCTVCGVEFEIILEEQACSSATEGKYDCDKCGQDFSCQHDEEEPIVTYDYIVNADRTHTVVTITTCANRECDVKELSRVPATETTPCTDENDDDYCDVCEADLTCLHAVQSVKYVHNEGWSHQMQIFCETCGDKLADTYEVCVNRAGNDELCDKCGKACDHDFAISYETKADETHVKVETCIHEGCGKVIKTDETCADTVHDSKCDACEDDMVCAHIGKTEHVAKEGEVHDIVSTCTVCGSETSCEKCKDYISTVEEGCVDADHNQKCDKCNDEVECQHDGNNTYVSNDDETHKVICGYCSQTISTEACVNETGSDLKCDKCGYNYAVATTGTADFMTIDEAITAVTEGGTVTLLKNVTLPAAMTVTKSLNLDLGGKKLAIELDATAIEVGNATVTVENGTIAAVNSVFRLVSGNLMLADDLTVTSEKGYVVYVKGGKLTTAADLTASGSNATITGNGLYAGDADIIGGTVTHTSDIAISWPQSGTLNITAGTVTGATALYVKGGKVNISGDAELIANGEKSDFVHGDNGASATGDALVVENSDYPAAPPEVTVSGGTFTSKNAAAAALYDVRTKDDQKVAPFITGGTFSSDVSALCAEGYVCTKHGDVYGVTAEAPVIEKFNISGANMTLGNELEMNVMFPKTAVDNADTALTAYVTHYSEDGDVVHTFTEFDTYGSDYYKVSFRVNAAQMTDIFRVEIKDADGNVYNNDYTNSVRNYVMTNIGRFNKTIQTLMVDMLNYGAAAQDQFSYHQDEYANALLSDEQKALATGDVEVRDLRVEGTNYAGSTLSLQDRILLNLVFNGKFTADQLAAMHATVTFDNALDGATQTHENVSLKAYGSTRFQVTVDQIVLADAVQPVTVTVYNADGTVYGSATDSVSNYICRKDDGSNPMYSSIMKFAASALAYGQSK